MSFLVSTVQLTNVLAPELVRSGNFTSRLLSVLAAKGRVRPSGQTFPSWSVDGYGSDTAFNFAENGNLNTYSADSQVLATMGWAKYGNGKTISDELIAQAKNSPSPLAMVDAVKEAIVKSANVVWRKVGSDLFSGTGSSHVLTGLDVAIGSNTNTYANISRISNPQWTPVLMSDSGSVTLAKMRSHLTTISNRISGGMVGGMVSGPIDLIVTTPSILQTIKSFGDNNFSGVFGTQTADGVNFGPSAVMVEGIPVIADPLATAGRIYYLNTSGMSVDYLPLPAETDCAPLGSVDAVNGGSILAPFYLKKIQGTNAGINFAVVSYLQLVVKEPFSMGVATGLS